MDQPPTADDVVDREYLAAKTTPGDIHEHIDVLYEYARQCRSVVECGVAQVCSSWAFVKGLRDAAAGDGQRRSYLGVDVERHENVAKLRKATIATGTVDFDFMVGDDLRLPLPAADLYFIDTWHVEAQIKRELAKFAPLAGKFMILHDTTVDAWSGETIRRGWNSRKQAELTGFPESEITTGIWPAVQRFVEQNAAAWKIRERRMNCNGLTVLERIGAPPAPASAVGLTGPDQSVRRDLVVALKPQPATIPAVVRYSSPHDVIVRDNALSNVDMLRKWALAQPYDVRGNYPGKRTKSFADDSLKAVLETLLGRKIVYWPTEKYNASVQLATAGDGMSWVHRDETDYGALLFLTPNAPPHTGTTFYRHKATGLEFSATDADAQRLGDTKENLNRALDQASQHLDAWDETDRIANVYNRLILFNGRRSHAASRYAPDQQYFGTGPEDGRLFLLFFFDVEK